MQTICRSELCLLAAEIIGKEFNAPNFNGNPIKKSHYSKARHIYVYFCRTQINATFPLIRQTILVYQCEKTVYQIFGRAYKKRKDPEHKKIIEKLSIQLDQAIKQKLLN